MARARGIGNNHLANCHGFLVNKSHERIKNPQAHWTSQAIDVPQEASSQGNHSIDVGVSDPIWAHAEA